MRNEDVYAKASPVEMAADLKTLHKTHPLPLLLRVARRLVLDYGIHRVVKQDRRQPWEAMNELGQPKRMKANYFRLLLNDSQDRIFVKIATAGQMYVDLCICQRQRRSFRFYFW